ncbi:type IV secretory system conjugative DNA transfer family protein [Streptomonospora sp. PA3]|uniref:type IV secretory system conjugative DNA transfer family protein n=1 Tax=Streptomonospora sp. PA3 TaxID=2607326 RepID=UPI0012DC52B7|nr:type IV secretory system conjugative DNA transfer family protein [Streptomonospora sp. PA3]MUL42917.1 type IV secretory system conjugative DNA transfer family protein [Streptomonospora sp. PA3]
MAWQSDKFQPRGGAMAAGTPPLLVVLALWGVVGLVGLVWVAAWLAALVTPGEVAPFSARWVLWLVTGDTARAWPGTPTPVVAAFCAAMAAGLGWAGRRGLVALRTRLGSEGDPVAVLNVGNEDVGELSRPAAAQKALRLRKTTLSGPHKALGERDVGLTLGEVKMPNGRSGPRLFASWEDTVLAYMAPRAGKTTALAIPYVLNAPGPALATSNKGDVWSATAALREQRTGERVWLFDPQHITHQKQEFWWNPLRHVRTVEDAYRLASHFVLTIDDDDSKKDMWGPAAKALLSQLMLAAALSGESLARVGEWLHDAKQPRPIEILFDHGFTAYAEALRETQNIVSETRDGIFTTARTAARCLDDPEIMEWVTPPADTGMDEFDPREFVRSRQTLHLLSKSRAASAPLIAAMTDAVFITAEEASEGMGGRLDPPLVAVLDEAANICKIADLPDLYSHLGSRGIVPVTILQSYRQGVRVWTENGMEAMWSAATVKLFGAGLDDQKIVEALSKLIGQHDVSTTSFSYGDGKGNHSVQLRRQEVMEGADIRRIGKGEALMFATAAQATLLKMCPWYTGPDAGAISAEIARAESSVTEGAQRRYAAVDSKDA